MFFFTFSTFISVDNFVIFGCELVTLELGSGYSLHHNIRLVVRHDLFGTKIMTNL